MQNLITDSNMNIQLLATSLYFLNLTGHLVVPGDVPLHILHIQCV